MRIEVMELEEDALGAAPAVGSHEGTPTAVSHPHGPLHWRRDVSRASWCARAVARLRNLGQLPASNIFEQQRQCPIEDHAGIAIPDLPTQEVLGSAQLLVRRGADGELHTVALRRKRRDCGPVRRRL
jgi:hypothetical protein